MVKLSSLQSEKEKFLRNVFSDCLMVLEVEKATSVNLQMFFVKMMQVGRFRVTEKFLTQVRLRGGTLTMSS